MTMIREFGDGRRGGRRVLPIWCPGYRFGSSFCWLGAQECGRGRAKRNTLPVQAGAPVPGGIGASGPAAATSIRSIARLSNWSTLEQPPQGIRCEVRVVPRSCADVSSQAPRSGLGVQPVDVRARAASNRATPRATAAAVTRTRAKRFATTAHESSAVRGESPRGSFERGDDPVPDDHLAIGDTRPPAARGSRGSRSFPLHAPTCQEFHHEFTGERVKRSGRFVREEDLGVSDKTAGQGDALGLPA